MNVLIDGPTAARALSTLGRGKILDRETFLRAGSQTPQLLEFQAEFGSQEEKGNEALLALPASHELDGTVMLVEKPGEHEQKHEASVPALAKKTED